jgi:hypothetical protein
MLLAPNLGLRTPLAKAYGVHDQVNVFSREAMPVQQISAPENLAESLVKAIHIHRSSGDVSALQSPHLFNHIIMLTLIYI